MHHIMYIGHLTPDDRKGFIVAKPLEIGVTLDILGKFCDKAFDGSPRLANADDPPLFNGLLPLGVVEEESVYYKDGFLQCPWFGRKLYNKTSIDFMVDLIDKLGCTLFARDDGIFMTKADLLLWVEEMPGEIANLNRLFRQGKLTLPERLGSDAGLQ